MVFQVKFCRRPRHLDDPVQWLLKAIDGERAKIQRLADTGADSYRLITNLSSTAHPQVGSFDRVHEYLEGLPIPADCWWRDDLNRRLDGSFDLKFAYPDLFTGPDFIRLLVDHDATSGEGKRRQRVVKAYLTQQYERDKEVRFRQGELTNDLLNMFIDVPAAVDTDDVSWKSQSEPNAHVAQLIHRLSAGGRPTARWYKRPDAETPPAAFGAGSLLLNGEFQSRAPQVIVEGAPGQGKSTMIQYVCQVHRMRLLDKDQVADLPKEHATSSVRLPFRIDLRDLAQWLSGENIFDEDGPRVPGPLRSIDGFLAAQMNASSGGAEFTVGDLHAVLGHSKILLGLDGLDEVVVKGDRGSIVKAIRECVERFRSLASSLQVVVTSRPSLIGTTSVPSEEFVLLRLQSITRDLIETYTNRWMDARSVSSEERRDLQSTLVSKLDQPHIRDLARNPMQLAILLNLVHRRGEALPDQRTALYSSYMEHFLDREAAKSLAVRDHRNVLFLLHGHIAWLLHCQAEKARGAGRFTTAQLQEVVAEFLEQHGYPRDLFSDLFDGVFARVGALASRVEGTYEFEIQPLREFFAAQYLYRTAPYSAAGSEKRGTRPERFEALVRHPYWLNVTRFYAGSYDIGELGTLAGHLETFDADETWGSTAYPRMVASRLLADWTFQQDRTIQGQVTDMLVGDLADRGCAGERDQTFSQRDLLSLPQECGGEELGRKAMAELRCEGREDRRIALAGLARAHILNADERMQEWVAGCDEVSDAMLSSWLRSAYQIDVHDRLSAANLPAFDPSNAEILDALLYAEMFGAVEGGEELTAGAIDRILDRPHTGYLPSIAGRQGGDHPFVSFAAVLMTDEVVSAHEENRVAKAVNTTGPRNERFEPLTRFLHFSQRLLVENRSRDWQRSVIPWDQLVEQGRGIFGDRRAFDHLAVIAAGVPDQRVRGGGHADLFDAARSLCRRARHARMRSRDAGWWRDTLKSAPDNQASEMALALLLLWGAPATIKATLSEIREAQARIAIDGIDRVVALLGRATSFKPAGSRPLAANVIEGSELSCELFALLHRRLRRADAEALYRRLEPTPSSRCGHAVLSRLMSYELARLRREPARWGRTVELVRQYYQGSGWQPQLSMFTVREVVDLKKMPIDVARKIVSESSFYPLDLIDLAENRSMLEAQATIRSVGDIADEDDWFARE